MTSRSCCPLPVEQSIDRAAFANLREFIPEFSLYLNESDINLFPNYGQYIHVRNFSVFYNNVFILCAVHCWYIIVMLVYCLVSVCTLEYIFWTKVQYFYGNLNKLFHKFGQVLTSSSKNQIQVQCTYMCQYQVLNSILAFYDVPVFYGILVS